jgi:catechol 2,3-dioxygenase-like lactoylglutathione lyase family enzyme
MHNIKQHIGSIALVVENYDDAIAFYTQKLRFDLIEDTNLGNGKRWVLIAPPNSNGTNLLLAQASTPQQLDSALYFSNLLLNIVYFAEL